MKKEFLKKIQYLECLMLLANDVKWLPRVTKIIELLDSEEADSLEHGVRVYNSMIQGVNSFNDFYFQDNNGIIRMKKNRILEDLKNDIWELINNVKE